VIRRIPGLSTAAPSHSEIADGEYLVRVNETRYRFDKNKPYFNFQFEVLEPVSLQRRLFSGRLYCHAKALWKLNWFLRDFSYDSEMLGVDQLDEHALVGLVGVIKISHKCINGRMLVNLDAFAPAERWSDFYGPASNTEVA
jgi:hypothetical protein